MVLLGRIDPGVTITSANAKDFDIKKFSGRVYAVRTTDSVVIKNVFASLGNFFEFLGQALFNHANTFIRSKNIIHIVKGLNQDAKTASLATNILGSKNIAPPAAPSPENKEVKERYYNLTDQFIPLNQGVIENLRTLYKSKTDAETQKYVAAELKSLSKLINTTEKKEKDVLAFEKEMGATQFKDGLNSLRYEIKNFYKSVKPETVPVVGITNVGNSCYMNSALQGLLGSQYVVKNIKEYSGNVPFMPVLQRFVAAYEKTPPSYKEIGDIAAELRYQLYHSQLRNMGLDELNDMADADLVITAIAEALGNKLNYQLASDLQADNGAQRVEYTNQIVWPHLNTNGSKKSAQTLFNEQCKGIKESIDGWKTEVNGVKETVNSATRSYYFEDAHNPPELIVLKVGLVHGNGQNAPFTPYNVGPRDATLDAGHAFRDEAENTQYRLIGILENHSRYHWTAKSLRDGTWYNCNDGTVTRLGKKVPSASAAIFIYERIH